MESSRRYVLIRVSPDDVITKVKVINGDTLASLDTTGTLTQKYQARLIVGVTQAELIAEEDTSHLLSHVNQGAVLDNSSPISCPSDQSLLPLQNIFDCLSPLVGQQFADQGHDQERNRGADLHRRVCLALGYNDYRDDGQFPDIRHQLLEVKLQTSPTIDLGLVSPDSEELLDIPMIAGVQIRHCDVRYALFYANTDGATVTLTHFFLTTGEAFFTRFPQFQGKVLNKKLQIQLPGDFFD